MLGIDPTKVEHLYTHCFGKVRDLTLNTHKTI